jgi:Fic family protein
MALADIFISIDALKKEADSLRPIAADRMKVLDDKLKLDWNYNSNAIEGNTLTLSETRVLLRTGIHAGNKLGRHYEEIKLHNDVLLTLEELVRHNEPMTEVLIRNLHHELMGDEYFVSAYDSLGHLVNVKGKPGEYKDRANGVNRIVNGKEVFIPFKTPDEVRAGMPALIQWYRDEEEKTEMHPVMLAAIFHFRFVTLHPFDDGNGRMSRILMNMILMRAGFVPAVIRVDERSQYISTLALAQDGGTIEPFIELVANDTKRSLELLVKAAKGESIEEPDDLDKEIEVLKRNLKPENDIIVDIQNKEYYSIWKESLFQLFNSVQNELYKFKDLFEKQIFICFRRDQPQFFNNSKQIEGLLTRISGEETFQIEYKFLSYKNIPFDSITYLEIKLHKRKYVISYKIETNNTIYEYRYNQSIETDIINKISHDLAKGILKNIKDNTSKK